MVSILGRLSYNKGKRTRSEFVNWTEILKETGTSIWMHSTHSRPWNMCANSDRSIYGKCLLIESNNFSIGTSNNFWVRK